MKNENKEGKTQGVPAQLPSLEARVRPFQKVQGRRETLAFADLIIGGAFVIKDVCILRTKPEGQEEFGQPFVSFPNRKGNEKAEGKYFDIAHPITTEAYKSATETIMRAYAQAEKEPVKA